VQPSQFPTQSTVALESTRQCTLTLELTGLRNSEGVIYAALFAGPDGFPNSADKAFKSGCFSIDSLPFQIEFTEVPLGRYAATVHHDENMDGQLNCNALGIPKEGIGFSRNPRIWKGVPPYQRAEFELTPDNTVISITMKYLLR
jgi:uncharacterized protein (DUF2141 family)